MDIQIGDRVKVKSDRGKMQGVLLGASVTVEEREIPPDDEHPYRRAVPGNRIVTLTIIVEPER